MGRPVALTLVCLFLACAVGTAAPPRANGGSSKSTTRKPTTEASVGLFDAIRSASGQVQHASDQLPVSYNTAASRFQNWAKSNEASISKTAVDVFSFARAVLKPLEAEVDRKAEADKKPAAGG
ncbi:uncharacterized protein LOC144180259 [Haemaphysalis longicornis]